LENPGEAIKRNDLVLIHFAALNGSPTDLQEKQKDNLLPQLSSFLADWGDRKGRIDQ
jgi:hypothetical protein